MVEIDITPPAESEKKTSLKDKLVRWLEVGPDDKLFQANTSLTKDTEIVKSYAERPSGRLSLLYEFLQNAIDYNDWEQGSIALEVAIGNQVYSYLDFLKLSDDQIKAEVTSAQESNQPITLAVKNYLRDGAFYPSSKLLDQGHTGDQTTLGMHGIGSKAAGACATASGWVESITFSSVDDQNRPWKAVCLMGENEGFSGERYNVGAVYTTERPKQTVVTLQQPDLDVIMAVKGLPSYFLPLNPEYRHNLVNAQPSGQGLVAYSVGLRAEAPGKNPHSQQEQMEEAERSQQEDMYSEKVETESPVRAWRPLQLDGYFSSLNRFDRSESKKKLLASTFTEHPRVEVLATKLSSNEVVDSTEDGVDALFRSLQHEVMVDGLKLGLRYGHCSILPLAIWSFGHKSIADTYQARRSEDSQWLQRVPSMLLAELYGRCTQPDIFAKIAKTMARFSQELATSKEDKSHRISDVVEFFARDSHFSRLVDQSTEVQAAIKEGVSSAFRSSGFDLEELQVTDSYSKFKQAMELKMPVFYAPSDIWKNILIDIVGLKKLDESKLWSQAETQKGSFTFKIYDKFPESEKNIALGLAQELLLNVFAFNGTVKVENGAIVITFLDEQPLFFRNGGDAPKVVSSLDDLDLDIRFLVRDFIRLAATNKTMNGLSQGKEKLFRILSGPTNIPAEQQSDYLEGESQDEGKAIYKMMVLSSGDVRWYRDNYQPMSDKRDSYEVGTLLSQAPELPADLADHQRFTRIELGHPDFKSSYIYQVLQKLIREVTNAETGAFDEKKLFKVISEEAVKGVTKVYKKLLEREAKQVKLMEAALGFVPPLENNEFRLLRLLDETSVNGGFVVKRAVVPLPSLYLHNFNLIPDKNVRGDIKDLIEGKVGVPLKDIDKTIEYHLARLHELVLASQAPDIEPCNMDWLPKYIDSTTLVFSYYNQPDGQDWDMSKPLQLEKMAQVDSNKPGLKFNLPIRFGQYALARFPATKPVGFFHPDPEVAATLAKSLSVYPDREGVNYALEVRTEIPAGLVIFYEEVKADPFEAKKVRTDDLETFGFDLSQAEDETGQKLFATEQQRRFFERLKNNPTISDKQKLTTVMYFWRRWFSYMSNDEKGEQTPSFVRRASQKSILEGRGRCYEAAMGLALLLKLVGLPARTVHAVAGGYNGFFPTMAGHAIVDVLIDNQWLTVEPQVLKNTVLSHDLHLAEMPWWQKFQIDKITDKKYKDSLNEFVDEMQAGRTFREEVEVRQDVMRITRLLEETANKLAGNRQLVTEVGREQLIEWVATILRDKQSLEQVISQRFDQMSRREQQEMRAAVNTLDEVVRQGVVRFKNEGTTIFDKKRLEGLGLDKNQVGPTYDKAKLSWRGQVGLLFARLANRLIAPELNKLIDYSTVEKYHQQQRGAARIVEEGLPVSGLDVDAFENSYDWEDDDE